MQTNNYIPNIVQRGARKATRIVCSGNWCMRNLKIQVNRGYRRNIKTQIHLIEKGDIDWEEYDDTPSRTCMCTSYDIA
jgi:hypothetical protein